MAEAYLARPKPPIDLGIPASGSTVQVSCIDSTTRVRLAMSPFLQPDYIGHPELLGPSFSFLIQHPRHKAILFDLAVRKDFNVLPSFPMWEKLKWQIHVEKDVATILKDSGVDVDGGAIDTIIWSHHHWDHVGDPATFPTTTKLVVGPGFKEAFLPGFPKNQKSTLMETDFEGREVIELDFVKDGQGLRFGRFNALDYFGDGSFYLLDTPGHSIGHICGLARTSTGPDTFIFMGGDASHHGGEFRPTEYLPIPREIDPSPLRRRAGVCPGHLLQEIHPYGSANKPFYHVTESFANDKKVADWTIDGLGEFDAQENVLLLVAHDDAVVDPPQFAFYPETMNDWYEKGIAKKVKWLFLGDYEAAVDAKAQGEEAFVWGKYP